MPKAFVLDEELSVTVIKRRRNRNLRLTVTPSGEVRVSIPAWAPYRAGVEFARARQAWIRAQAIQPHVLTDGQTVGKAHHLHFETADKPGTRVTATTILVRHPIELSPDDEAIQKMAREACVRALRQQAEQLLPQRLADLAAWHEFSYKNVSVKRMSGRWGSCDQQQRIVLNLFLMQLPWELIDYVLMHELVHTRVLKHGSEFWQAMERVLPDSKLQRKQLRNYHPVLSPGVAY